MTKSLESQFHDAMKNIYKSAKKECGYNANQFINMISSEGGLKTAKKLLQTKEIQYGFTELWECGRLDLTVEAHVLKPEFQALFNETEITEAKSRLESHGYSVDFKDADSLNQGDVSAGAQFNTDKYKVMYLESVDMPFKEKDIENTLNDMTDKGWILKQLSPGVHNESGFSKFWAFIVFEKNE